MAAKNMAKKGGLSPKDTRMVLFLLGVVLVACAYFFVFRGNVSKAEEKNTSNAELQKTLDELIDLESKKAATEEDTKLKQAEMREIINQFPSELTQEKVISIVDDMEEKTGVRFPSISMEMNVQFFPDPAVMAAEQAAQEQAAQEQAEGEAPAEGETPAEGEAVLEETKIPDDIITTDGLLGYVSIITLGYTGDYSNIKKMINYINNHEDKMRIDSINFGFDNSSGELSGTVIISMYSMYGNGKEYVAPKIKNVSIEIETLFSDSPEKEGNDGKKNKKNESAE